jgi:catechol 2,3-dioxygenase-like lactoylglutathione lyase family enzyme
LTQPRDGADWKVRSLFHININCSDLARSVAFYESVGFTQKYRFDFDGEADSSYAGNGVFGHTEHVGPCIMFIGDDPYQVRLDLMQWKVPAPPEHLPPLAWQVGVPRICVWAKNIDAMYEDLKAKGIEFEAPPAGPFPERAIERVLYTRDPDGLIFEFLEFMPSGRTLYNEASAASE